MPGGPIFPLHKWAGSHHIDTEEFYRLRKGVVEEPAAPWNLIGSQDPS